MSKKSAVLSASGILLVLFVLAGIWHNASAAYQNEKSIVYGKQGIFLPAGLDPENISLDRISPNEYRGAPVIFKRPLLDLEFRSESGQRLTIPYKMTYIFYSISKGEARQWEKGSLGIYYKDLTDGAWRSCHTIAVTDVGGVDPVTLTCVAPQATLFGLGKSRSE